MKVFYSKEYVGATTAFDTTRKSGWVAESLAKDPISGVEVFAPRSLTATDFAKVHSPNYVNAVRTGFPRALASSAGFGWDNGYWRGVCASNGGAVDAALTAYKHKTNAGSLSSGLHHAGYDRGMGFCTFNGLALSAVAARKAGAKRVLVIDLDAHCGGGTNDLLKNYEWVDSIDVSTSMLDSYKADNERWTLDDIVNARHYLKVVDHRLKEVEGREYDLCIYNSGMDPYGTCSIGGLRGIDFNTMTEREALVFGWCRDRKIPVSFVLAGGYTGGKLKEAELVALHRLTIKEAAL